MEFVKLKPINRICPCCGNGNYMRIITGKNVGELNVKCINCNSYYNYDELRKRDNGKPLNVADGRTIADLISRAAAIDALTDENIEMNFDSVYDGEIHRTKRAAIRIVANLPTVDAAPVIHCYDCLYFCDMSDMGKGYQCSYHSVMGSDGELENIFYTAPEAYCVWGERRDKDA